MKMFCLIILIFFYLFAGAQIDIGLKGGISISNFEAEIKQSNMPASERGMYGGFVFSFHLNPSLCLQPEINFSRQGGQQKGLQQVPLNIVNELNLFKGANPYADYKRAVILNYLEIPLLAKVLLGQRVRYYACFGPYIAFVINAKTTINGRSVLYSDASGTVPLIQNDAPYPAVSFNSVVDIKEGIKTANLGIQGGLGIQIPLRKGGIFFEGRTIIGVSNIQTRSNQDGKNQTGSLVVAAGYVIRIK